MFSPALISAVLFLCGMAGCMPKKGIDGSVDLRKVSTVSIRELYDKIELVPLDNSGGETASTPSLSGLSVTKDRFVFLDGDRAVLSYRQDGGLADTLNPGRPVMDFSVYQDRILDVLLKHEIRTYRLSDFSLLQCTFLDTLVTVTRLARREENVMNLPGYEGNRDYMCEYYFDTKRYFTSAGQMNSERVGSIVKGMRFLRKGDDLLVLYPHSGQIWKCGDFFGHFLWPDFIRRKGDELEFLFAQVTDGKVYYSLLLNGEKHLLVLNRADGKYLLAKTSREGLYLPLGMIRDGVNYFCCSAEDLPRYLMRDLLDPESAEAMDAVVRDGKNVVIKYHLAASE